MLSALFNCISSLIGAMYSAYKKTERVTRVGLIGVSINIVLGFLLTPGFKIWGVCIASTVSYLFQVIYKVYDVSSFCTIKYVKKSITFNILIIVAEVAVMLLNFQYNMLVAAALSLLLLIFNRKSLTSLAKCLLKKTT